MESVFRYSYLGSQYKLCSMGFPRAFPKLPIKVPILLNELSNDINGSDRYFQDIDECIAYADALRDRGIDARVVVEDIDRDEIETSVRGPVKVRFNRVTHPVVADDILEPAQGGAVEVMYETLEDLVQRIIATGQQSADMLERIRELERDNMRLRDMMDVASQRVARSQRREFLVQREMRQIWRFKFYDRMRIARLEAYARKHLAYRTKKQQTYKLIIGSIDVNAARYVLVLPMAVNTASLIFEGRLVLPVHVNAAITKEARVKSVVEKAEQDKQSAIIRTHACLVVGRKLTHLSVNANGCSVPKDVTNRGRFIQKNLKTRGMESGSHLSTLRRLHAWERKLYDKVKIVASKGIRDTRVIASSRAAEIYGPDILAQNVQVTPAYHLCFTELRHVNEKNEGKRQQEGRKERILDIDWTESLPVSKGT
ncbi:reverse transcriptase domain-containing protein [Tanacetum coccineum]